MKKLFLIVPLLSTIIFGSLFCDTSYAMQIETNQKNVLQSNHNSKVVPFKVIIEWRYRIINKKSYKRQFNRTTNKWIGQWILAE